MRILILLYGVLYIHFAIHELFHAAVAMIYHVPITVVHIGNTIFSLKISKLSVSPVLGGFVEVSRDALLALKKSKLILFWVSGSMGNLLCALFAYFVCRNIYGILFVGIGVLIFLCNMVVVFPNNDISNLLKCIKNHV